MPADVAERRRAKQRVNDGVQQHVGVGMAEQTERVRDLDPADDELAALGQLVRVPALADAK